MSRKSWTDRFFRKNNDEEHYEEDASFKMPLEDIIEKIEEYFKSVGCEYIIIDVFCEHHTSINQSILQLKFYFIVFFIINKPIFIFQQS